MKNEKSHPSADRPDPRYPYWTEWSDTGEIVYHVPVIADSEDALITLNAKENGGRQFICFRGGKPVSVVFIRTTNAAFAYDQRAYLNTLNSRETRYLQHHSFLEGIKEDKEGETVSGDENPALVCLETGYEEIEANDWRDSMLAYVREQFPKNSLYGCVLEQYLTYGYSAREIGEKLGIKERSVRYFLDKARETAGEYCR